MRVNGIWRRGANFHYHATGMPVFFSLPAVVSGIKLEVAVSVPVVVNSVHSQIMQMPVKLPVVSNGR